MKKIVSILSSIMLVGSVPTSTVGIINKTNLSKKYNHNKNKDNLFSKYNLSLLNKYTNNDLSHWDSNPKEKNNLNVDYKTIKNHWLFTTIRQSVFVCISEAIDMKYHKEEITLFKNMEIFANAAVGMYYEEIIYITILKEKGDYQPLNDNLHSFINISLQNTASYYLRLSNNRSMDWNTNKSYVDITVNIGDYLDTDNIN